MNEPASIRTWACLIVDDNSPLGRVASAVCELTAHLPEPEAAFLCSICFGKQWPCDRFDVAAREVLAARLALAALIPAELHHQLWPQSPRWPEQSPT